MLGHHAQLLLAAIDCCHGRPRHHDFQGDAVCWQNKPRDAPVADRHCSVLILLLSEVHLLSCHCCWLVLLETLRCPYHAASTMLNAATLAAQMC